MDKVITEKDYPIRTLWLFKQVIGAIIILPILYIFAFRNNMSGLFSPEGTFVFLFFLVFYGAVLCIPILINALRRSHFHYALEESFIVLHQGIISRQNRNVPYGRIQGVFVNQKLFERIFGLASVTFEDFSQGGKSGMGVDGYVGSGKSRREALGFVGNKIHIPGLKKADAEALKEAILQKIKDNPIEDNQSGL